MSHVKNVQAYGKLIGVCTGYGGKYNPGQKNLKLNAMRALLEKAQSSLQLVKQTKTGYDNVTNDREILFEEIRSRVTPVMRMLKATRATAQTIKDAYFYARLIKGRMAKSRPPIPSAESDEQQEMPEKSVRQRSSTQQSYVSLTEHFEWLIEMLESQPGYTPNEPELQIVSLREMLTQAKAVNSKVALTYNAWANARMKRNKVLYFAEEALYGSAAAVKHYVTAIYGTQSEEVKVLSRIRFTKDVS